MAASTTDILTAVQQIVIALNNQTTNNTNIAGAQDFFNITAPTVIKSGAGRIVRVSVVIIGSGVGTVYDASSSTDLSRPIYKVTFAATGIQIVDLPVQYGIVIVPGTGQTLAGSFS